MALQVALWIATVGAAIMGALSEEKRIEIRMPGIKVTTEDQYSCTAYHVTSESYIVQYEALSDASVAHHILLYGCKEPAENKTSWNSANVCGPTDSEMILFAWAKNAPATKLPPGVGYHIGGTTGVNYIVAQVHYGAIIPDSAPGDMSGIAIMTTNEKPTFAAGMLLMLSGRGMVPSNTPKVHIDVPCKFPGQATIHLFAYRTHAHSLSTVISGYLLKGNDWELLAKGNPQWPQAFYPMSAVHEIQPHDSIIARCTYDSTGTNHTVGMGGMHTDEMCNLYLMYYTNEAEGGKAFYSCSEGEAPDTALPPLPPDSDVPLPRNVTLEEHATGGGVHHHPGGSSEPNEDTGEHLSSQNDYEKVEIRVPPFRPPKEDYYACTSYKVTKEEYVAQYVALSDAAVAHHMLLYACEEAASSDAIWQCMGSPCGKGRSAVMFAWAKNAPPTHLPPDVGYHIGGSTAAQYLVLQVHYAAAVPASEPLDTSGVAIYISPAKPRYVAGIFVLSSSDGVIPANNPKVSVDVSCNFPGNAPIYAFAFRTHAHTLCSVISGYKHVGSAAGDWELLGKGNPQWPQSFYPMDKTHAINPNDVVVARCTYNSTGSGHAVYMGSTHTDEMCNLYLMYYTNESARGDVFYSCVNNRLGEKVTSTLPADSAEPMPPNPALDELAHGSAHHSSGSDGGNDKTASQTLTAVADWPPQAANLKLGQIAGLSTDAAGNVVLFHRGPVEWNAESFDYNDQYLQADKGPIKEDIVITLSEDGDVVQAWGKDLFYMPHGLTIDGDDNAYVTDVALHQVFRFSRSDRQKPSLMLGKRFKHGSDDASFCKPSDVAVRSDGMFYVSDGYCNARIKLYTKEGRLMKQWGKPGKGQGEFTLPHALALAEEMKLLCVADRVNARVQCFDLDGGFVSQVTDARFGAELYSLAFNPAIAGILYAVNGPHVGTVLSQGFMIDIHSRSVISTFSPTSEGFGQPHDVAVSRNGTFVYVAEIRPNRLWKFAMHENLPYDVRDKVPVEHKLLGDVSDDVLTTVPAKAVTSQKVPIIVGILLIVPVVVIVLIILGIKIYNARSGRYRKGFDMGKMLDNSTAHFNPLINSHSDQSSDSEDERDAEKQLLSRKPA